MWLKITELCVDCDVCDPVCPNQGVSLGVEIYEIALELYTQCVGHYDNAQCVKVCPCECIIVNPARLESREQLLGKYAALTAGAPP